MFFEPPWARFSCHLTLSSAPPAISSGGRIGSGRFPPEKFPHFDQVKLPHYPEFENPAIRFFKPKDPTTQESEVRMKSLWSLLCAPGFVLSAFCSPPGS